MELNKIADGKLQEAFDKALDEVLDACVQWGRKTGKDGTIVGAVQITLKVEGAQGGCASISDFAVGVKLPPRWADCYKAQSTSPQAPVVDERQLALIPSEEVWASFEEQQQPTVEA